VKYLQWKKYLPLTIACVVTGLLLTVTFRTQMAIMNEKEVDKNKTIIEIIDNLESETEILENNIDSMRKEIEKIQKQQSPEGFLVSLQNQVDQLKLLAGQTDVSGPGIIVVLEDNVSGADAAKTNNPELFNPEDYIVHDKNLLYLISEVRGQTEAIAINNQRLVPSSDIRCVGTVIMVNSSRLAPPYEIKLIGNPALLETAVLNSDEYAYLKSKDMPVSITRVDNINLSGYKGSNTANLTLPLDEGEGE
jgi:uncharacterized protein YlxW (UPF0749 family)